MLRAVSLRLPVAVAPYSAHAGYPDLDTEVLTHDACHCQGRCAEGLSESLGVNLSSEASKLGEHPAGDRGLVAEPTQ